MTTDRLPASTVEGVADLYRRTSRMLVGYATKLSGGNEQAADDLAHIAYLEAARCWSTVAGLTASAQVAWLRRVCVNRQIDAVRREIKLDTLLSRIQPTHEPDPADAIVSRVALEAVWAEVDRLPGNQRRAAMLCWFDDLSHVEAAEVLRIAPGTVRVHLHRAREQLLSRVGDLLPFPMKEEPILDAGQPERRREGA